MEFNQLKVLIIGNGISGKGAYDALTLLGAQPRIIESDTLPTDTKDYGLIVVSPSVRPQHPIFRFAAKKDIPLVGEIGLGAMINKRPVIGVTGTNGKTTTVGMLGEIYKKAGIKTIVCGNIGKSFALSAATQQYDRVILELSSFQLLNASPLRCHIACITNIEEDHLNYHGSYFEYKRAKLKIADRQTADDYIITRASDDYFINTDARVLGVSPVDFPISAGGLHNKINAAFAAKAAQLDGISDDIIKSALAEYTPEDYRIALTAEINGTKFYNDSKGTNVAATLAAVRTVSGSTALIVGGSDKGCSFEKLFDNLPSYVACVFVAGRTADRIIAAANVRGYNKIIRCDSLNDAVKEAGRGGFANVLFSPACASFDAYSNYAARGAAFDDAVKGLTN